jgi:phosphoribosylanthranilate isomerase
MRRRDDFLWPFNLPFMVSGGLNPDNLAESIRVTPADDVESPWAPGIKDVGMIDAFIRAARASQELTVR